MYVGHLVVETDFWRTGKPDGAQRSTAAIEARYKLLRSGLAITDENIILSNAFTIEQMDVTETINGMSCTNFGQEWLLTEKDQVRFFSTPLIGIVVTLMLIISDFFGRTNVRQGEY